MWNMLWAVSLMLSWNSPTPSLHAENSSAAEAMSALEDSTRKPNADHAAFSLSVGGEPIPYSVMAVFALPGEHVPIEVSPLESGVTVEAGVGTLESLGSNHWQWRAPLATGTYPVRVTRDRSEVLLNVFVMVPYEHMKRGALGSYYIGNYPKSSTRPGYDRPRGFVQVTAQNDTTRVAPHFRLSQFLCKAGSSYPKYLVLRPALLVKLERLLETAHDHGIHASTFQLLSAYRTPSYNRRIGNTTRFSRHHYGDAADIFLDERPADGRMDDLNGDGRQNSADARMLGSWAAQIDRETDELVGGLSAYSATDNHGPFVHVDARGYAARW